MSRLKILFADDQIPDENLPEADIVAETRRKNPGFSVGWYNANKAMRQAVKVLRDADYEVDVARTAEGVLSKIRDNHYDLAIVDLGWWGDKSIPEVRRPSYGFDICDEIEEIDKKTGKTTSIVIYSSRFAEEANISETAAAKGRLPVYKIYDKIGHEALKATVKFVEHLINRPSSLEKLLLKNLEELQQKEHDSLDQKSRQQKKWFNLTIICVAFSIGLLFVGAAGTIFWNLESGVLTSISSVLTSAISLLLFSQLRKAQSAVAVNLKDIKAQRKEYFEKWEAIQKKNNP